MELRLKQFKCYEEKIISFNKGVTLLQGPSGTGKSSIFEAIQFVLYGMRSNKVVTFGHNTCEVSMKFDNLIIKRFKKPNKLILIDNGKEYLDDVAQEIINTKFGIYFNITSYITQNGMDSFFALSPADRLKFLEKIAFGDVDIDKIKNKCKEKIKERKDKLLSNKGEYNVCKKEFDSIKEPIEVKFPLEGKYSEIKIKNESVRWKKNGKKLEKLREELKKLYEETSLNEHYIKDKLSTETQIKILQNQKSVFEEASKNINIQINISDIEQRIQYLSSLEELTRLKSYYNSENQNYLAMCVVELSNYETERDSLEKIEDIKDITKDLENSLKLKIELLTTKDRLEKTEKEINDLDTVDVYTNEISKLSEREQDLMHKKINLKDRKKIHKCPKCNVYLRLGDNSLELSEDYNPDNFTLNEKQIEKELSETRKNKEDYVESLKEIKRLLEKSAQYKKDLERLNNMSIDLSVNNETVLEHREKIRQQEERKKRLLYLKIKINNKDFSSSVQAIKRRLDIKANEIKTLEYNISLLNKEYDLEYKDDIEKLKEILTEKRIDKQRFEKFIKEIKDVSTNIERLEKKITSLKIVDTDFPALISEKENKIKETEKEDKEYKLRNELIQEYIEYRKEKENYEKWRLKLETINNQEKLILRSLNIAETLFTKIIETEHKAVVEIIYNINKHMKYYLDHFFEDSINVEIVEFKENNSGEIKPKIDIKVFYKNTESSIDCLSGGERSRVVLAICLAINSIVGSKILLLDEVLSSLNSELTEKVVDILRNEAKDCNKFIITVLHNSPEGIFDNVYLL